MAQRTLYLNQCLWSPRSPVTVKKLAKRLNYALVLQLALVATPSAENIVQWFDSNKGTTPLADHQH
jgi:hypothetical protein